MKQIWNEKIEVGSAESKHYAESSYTYDMGRLPAGVKTILHVYAITAVAAYDKNYGVLKLTLVCTKTDHGEFLPACSEIARCTDLQQFADREDAIRWLIDRIEEFKGQMAVLIPPSDDRSAEDVERAYFAEVERKKQAKASNE